MGTKGIKGPELLKSTILQQRRKEGSAYQSSYAFLPRLKPMLVFNSIGPLIPRQLDPAGARFLLFGRTVDQKGLRGYSVYA
jgi:hypothetical protein